MLSLQQLDRAVDGAAAFRRRQTLQPVGGQYDKIFPPTYPGEGRNPPPQHIYERRRIGHEDVWCVLIDSVQSQANRLEECLLQAVREGVPIPHITVDFRAASLDGITEITSLEAPHRVYDAILRDSALDGTPFMESPVGQRVVKAKPEDASALLEVSPTALLFGAWHSTGQGGGLGAKFARCLISEISAINVPVEFKEARSSATAYLVQNGERVQSVEPVTSARRPGSRIDPLGVLSKVTVFKSATGWDTAKARAGKDPKEAKPSEINHSNIRPSVQALGITCDRAEQSFVLSFAALRRLRFGGAERDRAGRNLLAALGLLAMVEQDARGYALRSRCDLVCDGRDPLQQIAADGGASEVVLDRGSARDLYLAAFAAAQGVGFQLSGEPLRLVPQDKLVEIVRRSQDLALRGLGGEEAEAGANEPGAGN
jgi:CRISPR-associated protein Csb1